MNSRSPKHCGWSAATCCTSRLSMLISISTSRTFLPASIASSSAFASSMPECHIRDIVWCHWPNEAQSAKLQFICCHTILKIVASSRICEGVWENRSHVRNFGYGLFCIFGCWRASWTFCFLNFENISIWGWVMAIYVSEIPVILKWRKLRLKFVVQILLSFCIQSSKSCSIS